MYKFLQLLEERAEGEAVNSQAWAWIVGLGLSLLALNSIETWLFWVVCEYYIRIVSMLLKPFRGTPGCCTSFRTVCLDRYKSYAT